MTQSHFIGKKSKINLFLHNSGLFSYGFSAIGKSIAQAFGAALGDATIAGVQIGKVFGTAALITGFQLSGGIIGGTTANYMANDLIGKRFDTKTAIDQGINGEVPDWIIKFFK